MPDSITLTSRQVAYLRRLAHPLQAVVLVGQKGVTPEVHQKVADELERHELIKVRLPEAEREERLALVGQLADASGAAVAQVVGRVVVLYRRRRKKPTLRLPPAEAQASAPK
jgi:RNA-binding protein